MNPTPGLETPEQRLAHLEAASDSQQRRTAIRAALEDETTLVRERAIALAARYLEPDYLATMVADDDNAVLRNAALGALERQGPYAVPCLQQMTTTANYEVAMFAVNVLARIKDPSTIPVLLPLLDHPDINVVQAAIEAVANLQACQAVPALLRLTRAEMWLQYPAVAALGEIGDARAVGALLELVENPMISEVAIEALGKIASPDSLERLLDWLLRDDRTLQRDKLLLAISAIVEKDSDPQRVFDLFARKVRVDARLQGLISYLEAAIVNPAPPEGDTSPAISDDRALVRGGNPLTRAAAAFAVAAQLEALYPAILLYAVDPSGARWVAELLHRYQAGVQASRATLLRHPDSRVRRGLLLTALFQEGDLPLLLEALNDGDPHVQAAACQALGEVRGAASIAPLVAKLQRGDAVARAAAADALGRMPAELLSPLQSCLEASDPALQCAALEVLVAARCCLFTGRVMQLLGQGPTSLRRSALRVLGVCPQPQAVEILIRTLDDSDETLRIESLELLIARRCQGAIPRMLDYLHHENPLRYHIIRGLGQFAEVSAAPRLQEIYEASSALEKIEIVAALSRIGAPGTVGFLTLRLQEKDNEIRRVAAFGLARLAEAQDLDLFRVMAEDADWYLRNEAGWGLGRLKLPEGREILMCLARDVEPVVARTARAALLKLS